MEERKCLFCGKTFLAANQPTQFCSVKCAINAGDRKNRRNSQTRLPSLRLPEDNRKAGKYITSLTRQEWVLRCVAREEEKWKDPPPDAVWVRTDGIYPGFLLRPEEVERLEEVIRSWTGGTLLEPVKMWKGEKT